MEREPFIVAIVSEIGNDRNAGPTKTEKAALHLASSVPLAAQETFADQGRFT